MALDAEVGGATANSYIDVEDADAFASADYGPERETWLDAGEADKELVLQRATTEIDDAARPTYTPYSSTQALRFPRYIDYTSAPITPFIPVAVKRATYYQAAFLLRNAKVIAAADTRRARDAQSVSEPNVSYTRSYNTRDETETPILSIRTIHALAGYARVGATRGLQSVVVAQSWG